MERSSSESYSKITSGSNETDEQGPSLLVNASEEEVETSVCNRENTGDVIVGVVRRGEER